MEGHSYKFLPSTGELEVNTRAGYKLLQGCSCVGIFEFQDRMVELGELLPSLSEEDAAKPLDALYVGHARFRHLCDRIFTLNGLNPDWVRPKDIEWLIFGHVDDEGNLHPSPLQVLNAPQEPRYPRKPGPEGKSDVAAVLAAISQRCGSLEKGFEVGTSQPARLVFAAMEEIAWHSLSAEEQDDTKFKDWARRQQEKASQTKPDLGAWGQ